jgi:hypothetical protein
VYDGNINKNTAIIWTGGLNMFDPHLRPKSVGGESTLQNWEADIHDIEVLKCDKAEDPLGYHVVFYTGERLRAAAVKNYVIGASHLAQRLNNLRKAGFDAPMTQRAIAMLEKNLGSGFYHA